MYRRTMSDFKTVSAIKSCENEKGAKFICSKELDWNEQDDDGNETLCNKT